jgi:hypothetical protein
MNLIDRRKILFKSYDETPSRRRLFNPRKERNEILDKLFVKKSNNSSTKDLNHSGFNVKININEDK